MSSLSRSRLAILVVLALTAVGCGSDEGSSEPETPDGRTLAEVFEDQRDAEGKFAGMGVVDVVVGDTAMTVVVADESRERSDGMRNRTDPDPYDGMIFVYTKDADSSFTMSGVTEALDIEFYDADGNPLGGHEMEPCPDGRSCASYPSPGPFRYAIETPPGELPEGPLRAP